MERRRKTRGRQAAAGAALLWLEKGDGTWHKIPAQIQDTSEFGLGLVLGELLQRSQAVLVEGGGILGPNGGRARGFVAWCTAASPGVFRAGIALEGAPAAKENPAEDSDDYYEILEVSPSASLDTIHKIYRLLAQRLHPDNVDSGSEDSFKRLAQAYRVLSDAEQRAAYDAQRTRKNVSRWRIFDPESAAPGLEQEQRKRWGILAVLYNKRLRQPEQCGVGPHELEQLLAVPREHLEFALWFMKEEGWIQRTDNAKHSITAKGVVHAEATGAWQPPSGRNAGLLAMSEAR